jgi:signal transduction histidine kinase/CheY-like chemotaxis protein
VTAKEISTAIRTEQLRAVFQQMPIALAVNLVNAALTAVVLFQIAARLLPLMWFSSVALVTAGRWLLWRAYRRAFPEPQETLGWPALAVCGSLAAGLCWGLGGVLLFPIVPVSGQVFLTFVIGGMCAGAVVLSASHLPTVLSFLLSASLPMAFLFFIRATVADAALGMMIFVFAAALSLAGVHLNRFFTEAMRLRFELNEANLHLQAEIAEHRATGAALRQAQKLEAVGQLTGGIAHDFNNLLTVVMGNLELASSRAGQNSTLLPLLQSASRAAERGVALVQRLLAFARKQRLDPQSVDLAGQITGIEGLLKQTLGPAILLEIVTDDDLTPAHVDANQVELAVLNLAINARDAMPEGGKLRIELRNRRVGPHSPAELAPGEYVLLSIIDTGIGMNEATLAQAFDPFFTTKEAGSGSGLGLSMVQGFALQSGGAVQIRSKPGEGTTVELWLPQAHEPPAKAAGSERAEPDLPPGTASILLCDDDDAVLSFLSELLRSNGYSVHEASNPEAALRLLENGLAADLLIVDYVTPGINGVETIRRARRLRAGLRALLITGHAGALGAELKDLPLLRKPFGPAALSQTVSEILAT